MNYQHHSAYSIPKPTDTIFDILTKTAQYFGVLTGYITYASRKRKVIEKRQMAIYLMTKAGHKQKDIAALFGLKRWTMEYSVGAMQDLIDTNPNYERDMKNLMAICNLKTLIT